MYEIISNKIAHTIVVRVATPEEFDTVRNSLESQDFVLTNNSYHYMAPDDKILTFEKQLS